MGPYLIIDYSKGRGPDRRNQNKIVDMEGDVF